MTMVTERACEHCGRAFTGRADKRFCTDKCRTAHGRASRSEPNRATDTARLAAVIPIRPEPAPAWEPQSQPRRAYLTAEPCPDCGRPLAASPRGTWRACVACTTALIPPAAAGQYNQDASPQRHVISQRDRDLAAIGLARRKNVMLGQLAAIAVDNRLHPDSLPVVDWFTAEVRAASSGERLDDLAALLPESGIRRRHWWQTAPAAIEPGWDDEDDQDHGEHEIGHAASGPAAIMAPPASGAGLRAEMTAAGALSRLGWRMAAIGPGCQIIEHSTSCGAETRFAVADANGGHAWICPVHNAAIGKLITRHDRELRQLRSPA